MKLSQAVLHKKLYGITEVDIHVPDYLNDFFEELPPVSKNKIIERRYLSAEMQEDAKEFGLMKIG